MKKAAIIGFVLCALGGGIAPLSAQLSVFPLPDGPLPGGITTPKADYQAFAGIWKVNASNGATFDLTLNVVGGLVSGTFQILGQPQYGGTLSGGTWGSGIIHFTWAQPLMPGGFIWGFGTLTVFTDDTFRGTLRYGGGAAFYPGTVVPAQPPRPDIKWTGVKHETGKPRPLDGTADGGNGPKATAVHATTVYKTHSGSSSASNKVCGIRPGDTGTVLSKGPDQWVDLANISGLSCVGQSGWVWNAGDLKLP